MVQTNRGIYSSVRLLGALTRSGCIQQCNHILPAEDKAFVATPAPWLESDPAQHSLGGQQHVLPGVELRGVGVLSAQVFCRRFGWEFCFTHVAKIPGQVDSFTCRWDRFTQCISTRLQGDIFSNSLRSGTVGVYFCWNQGALLSQVPPRSALPLWLSSWWAPLRVSHTHQLVHVGLNELPPPLNRSWSLPLVI